MSDDISTRNTSGPACGLLLVDKPAGVTSHDVVASIRRCVRPLKVGHTGTLDPLATGLLILCVGEATKLAGFIEIAQKQYRGTALFGIRTDTQDTTGNVLDERPLGGLTEREVRETAQSFVGKSEQTPPAFSAVKVNGVPAYKRARKRQEVRLKPRTIEISRLDIEGVTLPRVDFFVECSKGTYIRTLCHDLGDALGVGGCLESLRRLSIGGFRVDDAATPGELDARDEIMNALVPASRALSHMPVLKCNPDEIEKLFHGLPLGADDRLQPAEQGGWVQAVGPDGGLLAVGKLARDGDRLVFRPKRVFAGRPE